MVQIAELYKNYQEIRAALPFLDCYISDYPSAWDDAPQNSPVASRKLSFTTGNPRLVRQTDHTFEEIVRMAEESPEINFIIASGDRKLLYHFDILCKLLAGYDNLYVCTANLCNEYALERMIELGLKDKLIFGSMMPYYDAGQSLGPLVLGNFDWETKCAIAGNNFRRLLGEAAVITPEVKMKKLSPVIIDAHTHTIEDGTFSKFPPYNASADWQLWKKRMEESGCCRVIVTPAESIFNAGKISSQQLVSKMCRDSGGKVTYFEVFDPRYADKSYTNIEESLKDPYCIGIKIHPVEHSTPANSELYDLPFVLAERYGKPIMTHSWGASDYNPLQKFATPALFDIHLCNHPGVTLVFGHTGGRPNGFTEAVEMCRKHPQCMCDLAGDIFHNGFIQHAISEIGADKLIFATDIYWIDLRCMLAMLFENGVSADDMEKILWKNAERTYFPG